MADKFQENEPLENKKSYIRNNYLLGRMETKKHPNADISELHLSDVMIDLLKNDRIDAPLLCELASHTEFVKLLADIQIYIEGIATTQIQNLNSWVDVARDEIVQKYQPDNHDRTYQLLKASHIDEDEYFSKRVHDGIDCIMKDLREVHISRSDSAFEKSIAEELKQNFEKVMNFNGNRVEKLLMTFCMQTKIEYDKLSEEEQQWLIRIVQKSELLKSYIPRRGKRV